MGVRLGQFFNAHAVGAGGDGGEKYDNAGEDGDGDNFKSDHAPDHDDVEADGNNFKGTRTG